MSKYNQQKAVHMINLTAVVLLGQMKRLVRYITLINLSPTSKAYLLVVPIEIVADVFLFIHYPALDFAHNVLFGVKRE